MYGSDTIHGAAQYVTQKVNVKIHGSTRTRLRIRGKHEESKSPRSYHHALSDRYELTSRLENNYVGDRVGLGTAFGLINQTQAPLPSYDLTNFRIGVSSSDNWTAGLFANNLTNKHAYLEDVAQLGLPNAAYNRVATNQPRTIGVDLTYRH